MDWRQLIQALVDLNDGETIENDTTVVSAANLALDHLSRLFPSRGYISIIQDKDTADVQGKVSTSYCAGYVQYSPAALALDFIALIGLPHTPGGAPVPGLLLVDDTVLIPQSYTGTIIIDYRRQHENVTLDTVEHNGSIDVPPGCEDLLVLAMAYYTWLEDEPTKAERFLQMFNAQSAYELSVRGRIPRGDRVINSNGWR